MRFTVNCSMLFADRPLVARAAAARQCHSVQATHPLRGQGLEDAGDWDSTDVDGGGPGGDLDRAQGRWTLARIGKGIDRATSVISREIARNATKTRGYRMVTADVAAAKRRSRPQPRKVGLDPVLKARVLADLKQSRTPRQIAGRLHLEAADETVELMKGSTPAEGRTASHEAIYQFIYAMPRGELARNGSSCDASRSSAGRLKPQVSGAHRSSGWSPSTSVTRTRSTGGCPGLGKGSGDRQERRRHPRGAHVAVRGHPRPA